MNKRNYMLKLLKCVNKDGLEYLTLNKCYIGLFEYKRYNQYYQLMQDDGGYKVFYRKHLFTIISENSDLLEVLYA